MSHLAFGIVDHDTVVTAFVLGAIGLLLIGGGWFGLLTPKKGDETSAAAVHSLRLGLAGAGAVAGFLFSGWVVFGAYMAAFGAFIPTLRGAKKERRVAIDRVEAIANWVETIRDNEAVVPSLRRFAADLEHPTADMAVGCLILASTRSAGGLSDTLANTAQAARDSASMMRQIEAGRVQSQSQAKMVAILASIMTFLMMSANNDFLSPYDSFGGQIVLLFIGGMGAGATWAMYKLAKPSETKRVFSGVERAVVAVDRTTAEV